MDKRRLQIGGIMAALTVLIGAFAYAQVKKSPDVPYVPTRQKVVDEMLKLAKVSKSDVVYDLGCGDGRIVITAAKDYGATGVGVDIDPERIKEAKFIEGDLFEQDFSKATVVTLYLLPAINLKLRPQLLEQLKPGTRIVSHAFDMGDWKPEKTITVEGSTIYFWTVPEKKAAATP
jgi:trans-aconitate methyltransferase